MITYFATTSNNYSIKVDLKNSVAGNSINAEQANQTHMQLFNARGTITVILTKLANL